MEFFLTFSRQLSPTELKKFLDNPRTIRKKAPCLSNFKDEIDKFEAIYDKIKGFENSKIFQSWFLVDITPFKLTMQVSDYTLLTIMQ